MFYIIFIIVYLFAFLTLLLKKRSFDFLTIYVISLLLFNLSTFLGVVTDPYSRQYVEPNEYLFFYSSIPFVAVIFFLFNREKPIVHSMNKHLDYTIYFNLLLLFFFFCVYDNREAFFDSTSKMNMIGDLKFTSMLLLPIPSVGAVLSLMQKKHLYLLLFVCCGIVLFFLGSRSPLAILGLCLTVQYLSGKKFLIIEHYKLGIIGFLGLFVVILGKRLYGSVLAYGLIDGLTSWITNFKISYLAEGSEFLSTPLILNAVIEKDFTIPFMDVMGSLLAILPIPMSYWGLKSSVFNDKFQAELFSDMDYGMAYNIWAEAYSWLDLLGVTLYSIGIPMALTYLWKCYKKKQGSAISSLILLLGVLLSFWIHRNSIGSILGYIRNALYPILFIILFFKTILFVKLKLKNI